MKRSMIAVVGMVAVVVLAASPVLADWSDNFNGGNQLTWAVGGSGSATAQNNRYELSTAYSTSDQAVLSWVAAESFSDCLVSGRVQKVESDDVFLAYLVGRLNPTTGNGYVCGVSSGKTSPFNEPHLWLGKLAGGAYSSLAELSTQPSFNPADCQVEFSIVGSTLRGKVWSTGSAEPDWQIEGTDTSYNNGYGGVMAATYHVLNWDSVRVAFDDVAMTPEPATMALLALGGIGMLLRRKRSK